MITGSAMRKLEAQTGLACYHRDEPVGSGMIYILETGPGIGFYSRKKDEKEACKDLREQNWKRVCREVAEAQGHKCFDCGAMVGLQGHHVKFRSRWSRKDGPLDVASNVKALCSACHGKIHRP